VVYTVSGTLEEAVTLTMSGLDKPVLQQPLTANQTLEAGRYDDRQFLLNLTTVHEGIVTLALQSSDEELDVSQAFVILSVQRDPVFETVANVLGWVSTVAWDASFLPQIWHNFRRRSVEGLSFDFQTFNFLGFGLYFLFNAGLFWIPAIQDQFTIKHPNQVLHVRLNDVIFPLYAVICTGVQIVQCFFYKRAPGQRVSYACRIITGLLLLAVLIYCVLVPTVEHVLWLDVLYACSYVKLFISTIKYCPQLYVNYKARSTAGWNIGQVILDFTGGFMSIVQMFLIAANYDDYNSVLTDPTKLGLGLLSMFFNIFFFAQHFCLYRGNEIQSADSKREEDQQETSSKF